MDEYVVNLESQMGKLKDCFIDKKSSSSLENRILNEEEVLIENNEFHTINAVVYLNNK